MNSAPQFTVRAQHLASNDTTEWLQRLISATNSQFTSPILDLNSTAPLHAISEYGRFSAFRHHTDVVDDAG